eukprot:m.138076 g.138076  ORF g.138076 m.138076 type:complete len:50 (-) comp29969_c1_seq1:62-211(-)
MCKTQLGLKQTSINQTIKMKVDFETPTKLRGKLRTIDKGKKENNLTGPR